MNLMQPASATLSILPGDTLDLTFNLFTDYGGGARGPLQTDPGEIFVLTLGRIVISTSGAPASKLLMTSDDQKTTLFRQLSALETRRFTGNSCGQPLTWSLARVPTPTVRRTYVEGPIKLISPIAGGCGDQTFDLTVTEGGLTIDIGVPDVASYTDAREALIRQDMARELDRVENEAFAAALLF